AMGDKVKKLADSEQLGVTGGLYQVMSTKFLDQNADVGVRLMKAYDAAQQFMKSSPDKAIAIVAQYTKLEPAAAKPLVEAAEFNLLADQKMLDEMKLLGEWLVETGRLKTTQDYAKAIDTSYLQKANPALVTLK